MARSVPLASALILAGERLSFVKRSCPTAKKLPVAAFSYFEDALLPYQK
ncbi:hypothetical protein [Zymomonas mobilis]